MGASVFAVDSCCTAVNTINSPRNFQRGRYVCISVWSSNKRTDGTVGLALGAGYACGIQNTLTVGQEFTLSGEVAIGGGAGGASVGVSTTYTVEQAFQHTAGNCQACQLFACYPNVTVRQWDINSFYLFGFSTLKKRTSFQKRGAPTIMPCCVVNNSCPGCAGGAPSDGTPAFMDPGFRDQQADNTPGSGEITYIVDLRFPETYSGGMNLPSWHPMNPMNTMDPPGSTFDTLNCWQVWEIIREIHWFSTIEPDPITELAIIDETEDSPHVFDLINDPGAFGGCPADLDCNGTVEVVDVQIGIAVVLDGTLNPAIDANGDACPDACQP